MADLAEWFMDHPSVSWRQELNEAAGVTHEQVYRY